MKRLVAVRLPCHPTHHAQYIVVNGIDTELSINDGTLESTANERLNIGNKRSRETVSVERAVLNQRVGITNLQLKSRSVNTREVSTARRLVLLRLQRKRINVDTRRTRNVRVVLVRLHQVEVAALADRETIVTVQLQLHSRSRVARKQRARVLVVQRTKNVREVRPLVVSQHTLQIIHITRSNQVVVLHNPDQLLHRVVEVQTNTVVRSRQTLLARKLKLLNQILVRHLRETTTLISVKVNVVNVQRCTTQTQVSQALVRSDNQLRRLLELNVDANLMVLKRNQRKRQTNIAVEPELQRNVQSLTRLVLSRPLLKRAGELGLSAEATLTNHLLVTSLLTRRDSQLTPNLEPSAVLLVNTLTTDLNLNVLNQMMTNVINPTERGTLALNLGQINLHVNTVDQIAVTRNQRSNTLAEISLTTNVYTPPFGVFNLSSQIDMVKGLEHILSLILIRPTTICSLNCIHKIH